MTIKPIPTNVDLHAAYNNGCKNAAFQLAEINSITRQYHAAIEYYTEAHIRGHKEAAFELARMYAFDIYNPEFPEVAHLKNAQKWYKICMGKNHIAKNQYYIVGNVIKYLESNP